MLVVQDMASCRRCGRPLWDSNSVALGIGPVCAHKSGGFSYYKMSRPAINIRLPNSLISKKMLFRQDIPSKIIFKLPQPTRRISAATYLNNIGTSIVKGAFVYGLSAAVPPVGTVLIPAYHLYNYGKLTYRMASFFNNVVQTHPQGYNQETCNSLLKLSESAGKAISEPFASNIADDLTNFAKNSGVINEIATQARVDADIFSAMLKGSIGSGIASGIGNFTMYSVGNVIGG